MDRLGSPSLPSLPVQFHGGLFLCKEGKHLGCPCSHSMGAEVYILNVLSSQKPGWSASIILLFCMLTYPQAPRLILVMGESFVSRLRSFDRCVAEESLPFQVCSFKTCKILCVPLFPKIWEVSIQVLSFLLFYYEQWSQSRVAGCFKSFCAWSFLPSWHCPTDIRLFPSHSKMSEGPKWAIIA